MYVCVQNCTLCVIATVALTWVQVHTREWYHVQKMNGCGHAMLLRATLCWACSLLLWFLQSVTANKCILGVA